MSDFLLEVGCEEIPARMLPEGVRDLLARVTAALVAEGLAPVGEGRVFAGPRRMAITIAGVPDRQADRAERVIGPPADKAFDADGKPTRAGIGFAQKLGVEASALERIETPRGMCVAGTKFTAGQQARTVLGRILPELILGQSFAKTMRWGQGEVRYVRAIRNLVAMLDREVVEFEVAGVLASRVSFGHRFLGARRVELKSAQEYQPALAREQVVVAAEQRSEVIRGALLELAQAAGGQAEDDAALREEVTYFIEQPHVVLGRFAESALALPHEVLVTSMKHHQKGFPIWREPGVALAPAFLAVANVPDVEGHIARGFERVLNARLADAQFFWNEDRKLPLATRLPGLERMIFHEKLGSYAARTRRLEALAPAIASALAAPPEDEQSAAAAARLSKADLATGMVGEFAELQGVMGGLYLREEGQPEAIWRAVYEHYLPLAMDGALPQSTAGRALALADKIDTLVGCFGAGLVPTGTRDPFALRRAAQGVVRILLAADADVDLEPLLARAAELHAEHSGASGAMAGLKPLGAWLVERVEFVLRAQGHRGDTLRAVLATAPLSVRDAGLRARELSACRQQSGFDQALTVFKRVGNIAGHGGEVAFSPAQFQEPAERALGEAFEAVGSAVAAALGRREYAAALERVRELGDPLHQFFEQVRVLDADPALSENRKRLLRAIGNLVAPIGDLSQLQVEQGKATQ